METRTLVALIAALLLFVTVSQLNQLLGVWMLHLQLETLYFLFFALYAPPSTVLLLTFALAWFFHGLSPLPVEPYLRACLAISCVILLVRGRIRREHGKQIARLAGLAQLLFFLLLLLGYGWPEPVAPLTVFLNLGLSWVTVCLLAPLWATVQRAWVLRLGGELYPEESAS